MVPIYSFITKQKIIEVKSNTQTIFNVSELIESPIEHELLSFYSLTYYISTSNHSSTYDKYNFVKETQILTVEPSLNDWINFIFYFDGKTSGISTGFFLDNSKVTVRTCLFKCGQCMNEFNKCDNGTCKANFTLFEDSREKGCYPNDQNFPYYIYNKTTDFFEKCYPKCIFCSLMSNLSSDTSQNCKVCENGYLRSYTFMGNCYKVEYPYNTSEYFKIVNNINDESYSIVDSCYALNKIPINDTGECVDSCPKNTQFHTYYLNESLDFSQQEESFIGLLYPLNKEKTPQFLFNKVCYSNCPKLTYEDKNNSVCQCRYGWHYDPATGDKICYDEKDYCLSLDYYYHTDDKECVLSGCKENYFQINFECYKNECPENTKQISSDIKKCDSILKYCYIDENYKTQCRNRAYNGYNLKYDNTKTYFRNCNESLYYFNVTTYLYKNICYVDCPEETTKNDTNNRCSCNYYIYYVNEERTDYECLKETEKCWDKKRYNITDKKECVNTIEECTGEHYYIFNDECIPICPANSEVKSGTYGVCSCKYFYYTDNDFLVCFEDGKTCETENPGTGAVCAGDPEQ